MIRYYVTRVCRWTGIGLMLTAVLFTSAALRLPFPGDAIQASVVIAAIGVVLYAIGRRFRPTASWR